MGFSITTGLFPLVALLFGVGAFLVLLWDRPAGWWRRRVPIALAAAVAVTAGLTLFTNQVWHPFPDVLPAVAVIWIGLTIGGLSLALARKMPIGKRVGAVGLVALIGLCGAIQVNASFGAYPTIGAVFGQRLPNQVDIAQALGGTGTSAPVTAPNTAEQPLLDSWQPAVPVTAAGEVTTAPIPGTMSGFSARDAWIYLPPAYQSVPRAVLPVLVLLAGQPGEPRNWFDASGAAQTMDAYAAAHHGLAPVVVVPDWLGGGTANPLCVDSAAAGNDFTYLAVDVPNWIRTNLRIDTRPSRWAVGGLSSGATCAMQLAVNAPKVFPTFLCFSAQQEPTLSTRADTVAALFGGNEAAFIKVNPLDILRNTKFPDTAGVFVVGQQDPNFLPQVQTLYNAAKAAGIDAHYQELPGGHDFPFFGRALNASVAWLGTRLKITG